MAFLKHRPRRALNTRRATCSPCTQELSDSQKALEGEGQAPILPEEADPQILADSLSCQTEDFFLDDDDTPTSQPGDVEASLPSITCIVPLGRPDRLDRLLCAQPAMHGVSRERIKQAIRAGQCLVDGSPCLDPSTKIKPGQRVSCALVAEHSPLLPSAGPLECLYADEDLAVVNKPAHLAVHPCPSCQEETLVHRLLHRFPQLAAMGGERPGIVHRLDKDTSGLLLVALNERARLRLSADFADRNVHKVYLALVHGMPPEHGVCDAPLGRHPTVKVKMAVCTGGREALTEWQRLYVAPDRSFSLLAIRLHTGRK